MEATEHEHERRTHPVMGAALLLPGDRFDHDIPAVRVEDQVRRFRRSTHAARPG